MAKFGLGAGAMLAAAFASVGTPLQAQEQEQQQIQMLIDRGLTDDLPYTAIYPDVLRSVDDGSPETILTLQHPGAALQCDFFAVSDTRTGWQAEEALASLDVAGIEASWAPQFPGFRIVEQGTTRFASGAALLFVGQSDNSPLGIPATVVHAEAVENGRTYAVECLLDSSIAGEARPMVDFILANFSTNSDGQCCIDPTDDRG